MTYVKKEYSIIIDICQIYLGGIMPRPKKCRRVFALPEIKGMKPIGIPMRECNSPIIMTVEEYEAIRLIDFEGLTQEVCAKQMEVSRTTITAIYMEARKKISEALVKANVLIIAGGNFSLQYPHGHACCCSKRQKEEEEKE